MNYELLIIRYGELALKSEYVRKSFESILIKNIKNACKSDDLVCEIKKERGRIYLYSDDLTKSIEIVKRIFGITSCSPSVETTSEINDIIISALSITNEHCERIQSFALRVTRTGSHTYTSQEVAIQVGQAIVDKTSLKVDLSNPDFELFIEIRNNKAFLFIEKIRGTGGLPFGTQGKALSLIDSKESILAAWFLMKRGCNMVFLITDIKYNKILDLFQKTWYSKCVVIKGTSSKTKLPSEINKLVIQKNCLILVIGQSLYTEKPLDITEIKMIKQQITIPILLPLIAMTEEAIKKKSKEIGINI